MGRRSRGLKLVLPLVILCWLMVFVHPALASEFTADLVFSGKLMSGQGKIWVKDQKMRQEFGDAQNHMVSITDLDKGAAYVLLPDQKMYMKHKVESKKKGFRPENFLGTQQGMLKGTPEKLGSEKIMGYRCDKYLITFANEYMGTMTMWFSEELGIPIRSVNKTQMGEMVVDIKNIKEGSVQDSLFELPSGYQEMAQPAIPGMPRKQD